MEEVVVYLVFAACTSAALFAFMWGRRLSRDGYRVPQEIREDEAFASIVEGGFAVGGELDVEAPSAKALLDALALELANPYHALQSPWTRIGRSGRIEVVSQTEQELRFCGYDIAIGEGLIRLAPAGTGRLRVRWAVEASGVRLNIRLGQAWALLLSLPAAIIVPAIVYVKVIGNPNPAVAGQALQVLQTAQVAWEPFLFIGLGAQRMRIAGQYLVTLISGAAYETRTGRRAIAGGIMPTR